MLPENVQVLIDTAITKKETASSDKVSAVHAAAVTLAAQQDQASKEATSVASLADAKTAADAAVAGLAAFLAPTGAVEALRAALKAK